MTFRVKLESYCEGRDILAGNADFLYMNILHMLYFCEEDLSFIQIAERLGTNDKKVQRFKQEIALLAFGFSAALQRKFKNTLQKQQN